MDAENINRCLRGRSYLVVAENDLVQNSYHALSHFTSLLLRHIISLIQPGDEPGKWYSVDCLTFLALLRWTDSKYSRVAAALETLSSAVWWLRTTDGLQPMEGYIRYLSVPYSPRHFEVQFMPHIEPYLVSIRKRAEAYRQYLDELQRERDEGIERDPEQPVPAEVFYTAYPIDTISLMPHRYSHRLYELLKSHLNKRGWTYEIGTGSEFDLLPLLAECKQSPDGKLIVPAGWSNWSCFRRDVLEPAKEDIKNYSDLVIEYTGCRQDIHRRQTRGIRSIHFSIRAKNASELAQTNQEIDRLYEAYLQGVQEAQQAREGRSKKKTQEATLPDVPETPAVVDNDASVPYTQSANVGTLYSRKDLDDLLRDDASEYDDYVEPSKRATEYIDFDAFDIIEGELEDYDIFL